MRHDSEHVIELGYKGEEAVEAILQDLGYKVEPGGATGADLIIEGILTVEVKTAELSAASGNRQRRWQFCLHPHPGRDKPFDEDILILRCEASHPVHFVIPGLVVPPDLTKIDITSADPRKYMGKWSEFLEDWKVIDQLLDFISRGKVLLHAEM